MPDNWWDVPTDYFGSDLGDYTQPNFSLLDPSTGGTNLDLGSPGDWFYDTMTGQIVDQTFVTANGGAGGVVGGSSMGMPGATSPGGAGPASGGGGFTARDVIGALMAVGGLTTAGMGIASMFGGSDAANRTSTQTTTTGPAGGPGAMSPQAQQLLTGEVGPEALEGPEAAQAGARAPEWSTTPRPASTSRHRLPRLSTRLVSRTTRLPSAMPEA